jgi:mevalonate kinase
MHIETFSAQTKLLITGEYLVLKGALALAVPLRFKQQMTVTTTTNQQPLLVWQSRSNNNIWFECVMDTDDFQVEETNDKNICSMLQNLLAVCRKLNPDFLQRGVETHVEIDADFELNWGIGSSSTLVSMLAEWSGADPFELLEKTFGGSGYDIAAAKAKGPFFYQLKEKEKIVRQVNFLPPFTSQIGFVYLGKKMNSRTSMKYFNENSKYDNSIIHSISSITENISKAQNIDQIEDLLTQHESIMSSVLQMPAIKDSLFSDYPYCIKSLGAWGGDVAMFTCREMSEAREYFSKRNLGPVFTFDEIVLQPS